MSTFAGRGLVVLLVPLISGACSSAAVHDDGTLCDVGDGLLSLYALTTGPVGGDPYDGPAVVERSTADDLVLAFSSPELPAGAPLRHVQVGGLAPMPILPPGAKVWLTKNLAGEQVEDKISHGTLPWAFSVRDGQGGRLLFGGLHNTSDAVGVPVTVGAVQPICSMPSPTGCHAPGAHPTITYRSVEILGDTTVAIASGSSGRVAIDGVDYDVSVEAHLLTDALDGCGDSWGLELLDVALQAHDMAGLVAGLPLGEPPACGNGSAPLRFLYFWLEDDGGGIAGGYDGRAVFRGPDPESPRFDDFDVPDLAGPFKGRPHLDIEGLRPLFTPIPQATYWVTMGSSVPVQVLRASKTGPLILADLDAPDLPLSPAVAADLHSLLGVTVDVEQRCTYTTDFASNPVPLWDVVLGTTPPTRVPAGGAGTLDVGGRSYTVEVYGIGILKMLVYPTH